MSSCSSRGESSVKVFTTVANNKEAKPLARLHAVWGLTQLGRNGRLVPAAQYRFPADGERILFGCNTLDPSLKRL